MALDVEMMMEEIGEQEQDEMQGGNRSRWDNARLQVVLVDYLDEEE
jgi:hypothetical protein